MDNPEAWAHSYYDIEEMWGVIELPPDEFFPVDTLELLVLHELAHGLLKLAAEEGVLVEQSCNRVARLARGDFVTPLMNEQRESALGDGFYDVEGADRHSAKREHNLGTARGACAAIDKRKWLAVVADALPKGERDVISALYYEGLSMRETATRLGVDVHTVFRRKDSALKKLRSYYEGLDATAFEDKYAGYSEWTNARKLIELRQPEGGAEHETVYTTHHRCSPANSLARAMDDNDIDLLVFPCGNVGYAMPRNTVFAVRALAPCGACGADLTCQFVWRRGHVNHGGHLWTPAEG